jgi:outer membrane receptor protein involved in Fe transport
LNTDPDINETNRTFDTEFNNAFEAGLKSSLLDDQLNTRLAVFYIKRKDQQVKSSYAIQAQDNSITFQDYLANAAEGKNYGVELESDWQLTEQLNWQLSYGYLITEFLDYDYRTEKGEFSKNGRAQAHAPQYSLATGVSYDFDNGLAISVQSEAKDEFYFSDSHDEQSRAYVLWHARLSYDAERWQGAIFGRNLTDVDQEVRGFHFGNDPRDGYSNKRWVQYGEPRLIGVEGKFFF